MIHLSDRLQMIADEIASNETMADIGTDHGFLPIYLWEKGISPHVILADISEGSLAKARESCEETHPEHTFDLRCGNGLQVLENGETDAVVMAGIGGLLMVELLENDLEKSHSFSKFVLQPRKVPGMLRHFLVNHGFPIAQEHLVREGKYICEILTVEGKYDTAAGSIEDAEFQRSDNFPRQKALHEFWQPLVGLDDPKLAIKWEVPAYYAMRKDEHPCGMADDPLIRDYLGVKLLREERKLAEMANSQSETEKKDIVKSNISYLQSLIAKLEKKEEDA